MYKVTNLVYLAGNTTFTWDLGVIAFLFFAAFFYGLNVGSSRMVTFLVSLYFAVILLEYAPYIDRFLGTFVGFQRIAVETGIFVVVALVLFLLISGSALRSALRAPKKEESRWWHLLLLGFVTTGVFTASVLAFFPESYYNNLSVITRELFIFNNAIFWWSLAGILSFVILRKTKKET